jgi:hypothetical protein
MNAILIALAALVAVSLVRPLLLMVLGRIFAGAIGNHALAKQPDEIHLERAGVRPWARPEKAEESARTLRAAGFEDAGTWTVPELPGVVLQLLAHAGEGFYGVIYQHPKAGDWMDMVTRFSDGTSITFSSHTPSGLESRPGHPVQNLPGVTAGKLLEHARAARPRRAAAPHSAARATTDFTRAYAESMAWRKQHGVSAKEVAQVIRKAA